MSELSVRCPQHLVVLGGSARYDFTSDDKPRRSVDFARFGYRRGFGRAVSLRATGSIIRWFRRGITASRLRKRHVNLYGELPGNAVESRRECCVRSEWTVRKSAVSNSQIRARGAKVGAADWYRPRCGVRWLPGVLDLGYAPESEGETALTLRHGWATTGGGGNREDSFLTRVGRMLLRQTSALLLVCCFGMAYSAPALAQGGPAPDPGPPRSRTPAPEPAPGATPPPPPPPRTVVSPAPVAPPAPAPAPAFDPQPAPARVEPPATPPPAANRSERTRTPRRETARKKPIRVRTAPAAAKRALPTLGTEEAGLQDDMLLIGGLALLLLVVCDTVFLTLSTRGLRGAG